jgi:hypothetical protein
MLLSQLVEVPERLESALLLLAPRYDTPNMIIKVINARIRQKHSPSRWAQRVTPSARIFRRIRTRRICLLRRVKSVLRKRRRRIESFSRRQNGLKSLSRRQNSVVSSTLRHSGNLLMLLLPFFPPLLLLSSPLWCSAPCHPWFLFKMQL